MFQSSLPDFGLASEAVPWGIRMWEEERRIRGQADRALRRRMGERVAVTEESLEAAILLESLWLNWDRAIAAKPAASALHKAAVEVDSQFAGLWIPTVFSPSCSRARFSRGLRVLWRARKRGHRRGELAERALALVCEVPGVPHEEVVAGPTRAARHCEGRSRAPQAGGRSRSGAGSSSGRGDGSGGGDGGSGGPGEGDGSGSGRRRWQLVWAALSAIGTVVAAVFVALGFFAASQTPVVIERTIIERPARPTDDRLKRRPPAEKSQAPENRAGPGADLR